jgi:hypothetical protein
LSEIQVVEKEYLLMNTPEETRTLALAWVKQGTIHWEEWWVKRHGETLKKVPGLQNHVSFANYDLNRSGCPPVVLEDDKLEIHNVPLSKLDVVQQIIEYHGFQIVS